MVSIYEQAINYNDCSSIPLGFISSFTSWCKFFKLRHSQKCNKYLQTYTHTHLVFVNTLDLKLVLSNFHLTPLPQFINGSLQAAVQLAGKVSLQHTGITQGELLAKGSQFLRADMTRSFSQLYLHWYTSLQQLIPEIGYDIP